MADYRVESRTLAGAYLAALPYRNLQFELGWNKAYTARFELPLYHDAVSSSTLQPGLHEIWIWRNGVLVKAGPLWDVTPSSGEASINCNMADVVDYLDCRLVGDQNYVTTDQGSIAWGLISTSQSLTGGALGIVQGTTATGITRSESWKQFDNKYVLEAISDLSSLTQGFDFSIDPSTRAFNAIYPRPQRNNGLQLIYPYHIRKYSVQYMGKFLRNSVGVAGTEPAYSTAVDTTSRSTYGLREYADSYRDAATVTDLNNYASRLRDIRKDVKTYPTVTLNNDLIDIFNTNVIKYGDLVGVQISDGYVQINQTLRYISAQITVDKQGAEAVVLYLQDQRELN
jgi:hypothetical protein